MARDVGPGDPVLINDGLIQLEAERTEGESLVCVVRAGGVVSDHKGINLPKTTTSVPALTQKDRRDLAFAVEMGFDYVALSFVRKVDDILETRRLAEGIPIIAKVEKPEAIGNLEAILDAADAVMIARGDLGVEMGQEKVPLIQKRIIMGMLPRAKPVITATQMLESMITNAAPTRAEVSDVANAVLDGTDAVMLSAETASGKHPVRVVETMAKIIREVEESKFKNKNLTEPVMKDRSFSSAMAEAVTSAAEEFDLAAMAIYTESGLSAALVSAERPAAHIVAFTRHGKVLNRLALHWGVRPLHGEWVKGVEGVVEQAERQLLSCGYVVPGDNIAVTFGMRLGDEPFQTNMMKLWKVREDRSKPLEPKRSLPPRGQGESLP
jgi:pyruvate kinase